MNLLLKEDESTRFKTRIYVVSIAVIALIMIVMGRLWFLQVVRFEFFKRLAQNNSIRILRLPAPRGIIFDSRGKTIVTNKPGFDLILTREDISKKENVIINKLSQLVDISPHNIRKTINRNRDRSPYQPIVLKENLRWDEIARIETHSDDIPGIRLAVVPRREYALKDVGAHIIGYMGEIDNTGLLQYRDAGYRQGDKIGKTGVEERLEKYLKGKLGGSQVEVDALGRQIAVLGEIKPSPGDNIYLTIDLHTQLTASKLLEGRTGAVVAMDPSNGKIIAMASSPSFDPNVFTTHLSTDNWKSLANDSENIFIDRAIQGQYPPASTFKVITAAAILEDGLIDKETKIFSGGSFQVGKRAFRDWKDKGHGKINIHRAIVESSDTFFYQAGLKLGISRISYYASLFGLGKRTGIRLKGESAGTIPTREWKLEETGRRWYDGETVSAAVGQGYVLATPLQILNAFSAIANGGKLYKPKIIEMVVEPGGKIIERFHPEKIRDLPLSDKTIETIQSALRGVINEKGGTASNIRSSKVTIAGKTGTAQVASLKDIRKKQRDIPYGLRDHAWFVGYAPANKPRIAVAVLIEHGGFGSTSAAPIAKRIIESYLRLDGKV